jgi:hypothetical protein
MQAAARLPVHMFPVPAPPGPTVYSRGRPRQPLLAPECCDASFALVSSLTKHPWLPV